LPTANVLVVSDYEEALRALDFGQAAAILADDTILIGTMQQHPGRYRLVGDNLTSEPYAAAVAQGNRYLLNAVDVAIRKFKESGAWTESFARHFPGLPVPEPPKLARRSTLADLRGSTSTNELVKLPDAPLSEAKPDTVLHRIQQRGYIVIAVKDNVPGFSYRDPKTKELSGLEIDIARAIAQYIFNDPTKVKFEIAKVRERIPFLRSFLQFLDPILKLFSILSTSLSSNWWHLGMAGKLDECFCPKECVGEQDFVGIDYYWGIGSLRLHQIQKLLNAAVGRFGNAPVLPGLLYDMLKFHAQLFPDSEIMVIENGCVEVADGIDRATYIKDHLNEVERARRDGVNVIGYVSWSITSNREWGLPFSPSSDFGLYHIDLDSDPDLLRKPTLAAQLYQQAIASHTDGA
jgi:ABC-type amino acid transport substrate-binding protein